MGGWHLVVSPDVERRHLGRRYRIVLDAARAIPGDRRFHSRRIAEHRKVRIDLRRWHAIARQPITHPFGIVGEHLWRGIWLKQPLMVAGAFCLLAVGHREGAEKRARVRAREHGERGNALGPAVGDVPGQDASPIMADEMETWRAA